VKDTRFTIAIFINSAVPLTLLAGIGIIIASG
jgi:hypothetical protein